MQGMETKLLYGKTHFTIKEVIYIPWSKTCKTADWSLKKEQNASDFLLIKVLFFLTGFPIQLTQTKFKTKYLYQILFCALNLYSKPLKTYKIMSFLSCPIFPSSLEKNAVEHIQV